MGLGPLPQLGRGENVQLELVPTTEEAYVSNRNCVALITDQNLYYIRKRVLGQYWSMEAIPRAKIEEIHHGRRFAVGAMMGGLLLVILAALVLYYGVTGRLIPS